MTEYTAVTFIVVLAALRQAAELAAVAADPLDGAGTFVPGTALRTAGDPLNTPAAYWCRWNMKPSQRADFATTIGGPLNVLAAGATVPKNRDRYFFDANGWSGAQVLAALGLDTLKPVVGPGE